MFTYDNETEVQRWVYKFDQIVFGMEAKWGVDRLPELCGEQTRQKWQTQIEKLNAAIEAENVPEIQNLVEGCVRGIKRMEEEAETNGHTPAFPMYLETRFPASGRVLRICVDDYAAKQAIAPSVVVWTIQEVSRVLEKDYDLVTKVKGHFPEAKLAEVSEPFDFEKGDSVEF